MESNNASIVVLKTGAQVICDLREVFDGEGENKKGVCLLMIHPYELSLISAPEFSKNNEDLQVKFSKWCPFSTDTQYKISYNAIIAIGTPDTGLEEAYRTKINIITQNINNNLEPETAKVGVVNPEVMSDG
jgi:hypothetical protein